MRTNNSIKNIYFSLMTQLVMVILGFISRRVFIDNLGTEYLGVNGLLTNILSMLSLVEGGMGASIIYNLYKPIAENDKYKIIALVQLYKKIYIIIAILVFIISIAIYPFIGVVMKGDSNVPFIGVVYFIFVLKNIISYLNAHKWSLINADQKGYIIVRYNLVFNIITTISKICILKLTQNYVLFLTIEVLIFIIQNIWNGHVVNKRYPYIKSKEKYKIDNEVKDNLITNVKALFLHNIGSYCVFSTDNLLIGGFINVATVGLYSNYNMITGQLHSLISPILGGIGASVGNLIAIEDVKKKYQIFNVIYLVNFWLYSIAVIFLFNLLEPAITLFFGNGLLIDKLTFIVILVNFYLNGLRSSVITFKTKGGIFSQDKYVTIIVAIINLTTSIFLVKYLGLAGIFLGTTISTISIPLWYQPKLVYNIIFNKSVFEYIKKYLMYLVITIIVGALTTSICSVINIKYTLIELIIKGIVCIFIPSIIYLIAFFKTDELKYLITVMKNIIAEKIISSKKVKLQSE